MLGEIERRKEKERFRFFVPNGKQEEVIRAVGDGGNFIVLFSAANGVGKTALVMNILAHIIWGPQNEWFDYPLFKDWPYPKRIRIGTESGNVGEGGVIDTEIKKWWPEGRYDAKKAGKLYFSQYSTDTGWVIDKMTYEQETKEWESVTLGLAVLDEPPPEDKFSATISRMRQGGVIVIPMTPLTNAAWVFDKLVDSHKEKTYSVFADIESNCKKHGIRGTLDHDHIQLMIENMDPEEVEARAHGKFMHLSNVILGNSFNRDVHLIDDSVEKPRGAEWGMVVDPAVGKPWAMAWFWVDARGQVVFDEEYPNMEWMRARESNLTIRDYADIIKRLEHHRRMEWRILDRHFGNARDNYGSTLKIELVDKFALDFQDSYNCEEELETGIQAMKDYLKVDPILKKPRVLFKRRCKNIIRALERWSRDPISGKPDRNSMYKDHFDLVRYVCGGRLEVFQYKPFVPQPPRYVLGR